MNLKLDSENSLEDMEALYADLKDFLSKNDA